MPSSPPDSRPDGAARRLAGVDRLVRAAALWGGGAALLALMLLMVLDVALRYGISAPLYGAHDLAKLLLLGMVALALGYSARTGGQVAVELGGRLMGPVLTRCSAVGTRILALAMLLVTAAQLVRNAFDAGRFGESSLALGIPFAPFYLLLALGMLFYALALAAEIPLLLRGRSIAPDVAP
jgi:TRAP-type C4-dicarboxylate transport system permease small subunit